MSYAYVCAYAWQAEMLQRMAAGMQAERSLTLTTAGGLTSTAR